MTGVAAVEEVSRGSLSLLARSANEPPIYSLVGQIKRLTSKAVLVGSTFRTKISRAYMGAGRKCVKLVPTSEAWLYLGRLVCLGLFSGSSRCVVTSLPFCPISRLSGTVRS